MTNFLAAATKNHQNMTEKIAESNIKLEQHKHIHLIS